MEQITLFQAIEEKTAEQYVDKWFREIKGGAIIQVVGVSSQMEGSAIRDAGWVEVVSKSGRYRSSMHINKIDKECEEIKP